MHTLLLPKFCAEAGLLRDFQGFLPPGMKPWKWVHCFSFRFTWPFLNWLPWLPVSDTHLTGTMTVHMCGKFRITRVLVISHTHCKTNLFWDACISTEYYLLRKFIQLTIAHWSVSTQSINMKKKITQVAVYHEHNNYNINLSTLVYVYLKMALFHVF